MKKITVKKLDEVISRLTINELILFKAIKKEWLNSVTDNEEAEVHVITSINRLYQQSCFCIEESFIPKILKSLCDSHVISTAADFSTLHKDDKFTLIVNWDNEI